MNRLFRQFSNNFSSRGKPRIIETINTESEDKGARLYSLERVKLVSHSTKLGLPLATVFSIEYRIHLNFER
jgi:hypothetical protein